MIDAVDAAAFKSLCEPVPAADFIDLLWRVGFSAEAYREAHSDLAGRNWDTQTILWHLFRHGLDERRVAPQRVEPQALVAMARLPMYGGAFKAKLLTYLSQHLFEHVDAPNSAGPDGGAIAERWDIVQALTREGGCPYFIAGDSHSSHYALDRGKIRRLDVADPSAVHRRFGGRSRQLRITLRLRPATYNGRFRPSEHCPMRIDYRFCCSSVRSISSSFTTTGA